MVKMRALFVFVAGLCFAETKSELNQRAQEKLESSYEHMGLGLVEMGVGAFQFSRGDAISGSALIGSGAKEIKDSYRDFSEAVELSKRGRECDD
ncbi:MAG: hypothetical protein WDZ28_00030 [Simkaniaceae bacterium]